jgi:hypothetical protein
MTHLYTYIVRVDAGLAPNPFWGWCTLAVCTPNHQGSAVSPGDWIAGFSTKDTGYQFIYAMEVDERIHMKDYFNDLRFQEKKPIMEGNWKQRCGDNIYNLIQDNWVPLPNPYHEGMQEQDTQHPFVFVGHKYWYLGKARVNTPLDFLPMIGGRGARVNHPEGLPERFKSWVQSTFAEGIAAEPLDAESIANCAPQEERCSP